MAELVDALDLGSNALRRKGSSPFTLTKRKDFRFFNRKSFLDFLKFFLKRFGFLNNCALDSKMFVALRQRIRSIFCKNVCVNIIGGRHL